MIMVRPIAYFLVAFALASSPFSSRGAMVYSDNFDTGSSPFTASAFFLDQSLGNGVITKSAVDPGAGINVTSDVSGSGYFLFNETGGNTPAGQNVFYISPTFAVTANTNYTLSFYLTNGDLINPAQVQALISGVVIGGPVSAIGTYNTNGFQQFNFSFNSGAATSETLTLNDLVTTGTGNDFGIDAIVVSSAVPEPSSLVLCGIASLAGLGYAARRWKADGR